MKKGLILMTLIFTLCGCSVEFAPDYYYEYKDLEGNEGKADECSFMYGNMTCELNDGTRIKVQSYKRCQND